MIIIVCGLLLAIVGVLKGKSFTGQLDKQSPMKYDYNRIEHLEHWYPGIRVDIPYRIKNLKVDSLPNKIITYSEIWHQYLTIKEQLYQNRSIVNDSLLDFDGLVMDETQSKLGKDFYDIFYKEWDSPKHVLNYTIVIREKPVPSLGTQIMVVIDDKTVFQNFLQPRIEIIEEAAKAAVAYSRQYLQIYHKSIFK
ncbi:MAG TPA: CsgE family curli-type amyloid fiber assembly protein [Balneolales bacterium]|nr:CsgE family curli-type amyloid fiber assembly protein [Balneolales bacterium]